MAPPAAPLLPAAVASFDVDESVASLVLQHVEDELDRFALAGVSRWGPYSTSWWLTHSLKKAALIQPLSPDSEKLVHSLHACKWVYLYHYFSGVEISGGHERDPLHLLMAKTRAAAEAARSARREAYGREVGTAPNVHWADVLHQDTRRAPGVLRRWTWPLFGADGHSLAWPATPHRRPQLLPRCDIYSSSSRSLSNTGIQRWPRKKRLNKLRLAGCAVRYSDVRLLDKFVRHKRACFV